MSVPSTILLVRHGMTDYVGRALAGRMAGVHLNAEGRRQADLLPRRLAAVPVAAIYSSPLERALETAAPIEAALSLDIGLREGAAELDFGEWTGRRMADLESDPLWRRFNTHRSTTRPPGGELMAEAGARMVAVIDEVRAAHPGRTSLLVSHADVIRAALAHYAGISLDTVGRIAIDPASVTTLEFHGDSVVIRRVNDGGDGAG